MKTHINFEDLFKMAKDKGFKAIGICEEGTLRGAIDIFVYSKKYDIKPIIGCIFVFSVNGVEVKIALYPKNNIEFSKLIKLSSEYNKNDCKGFDISTISNFKNSLFVIDTNSLTNERILNEVIKEIGKKVNKENLYLGLKEGLERSFEKFNSNLLKSNPSFKYVVFNELLYLDVEEQGLSETLLSIKKVALDEEIDYCLIEEEDILNTFGYLGEKPSNQDFEKNIDISFYNNKTQKKIPNFTENIFVKISPLFIHLFRDYYEKNKKNDFAYVKNAAYLFSQTLRGMVFKYSKDIELTKELLKKFEKNNNVSQHLALLEKIVDKKVIERVFEELDVIINNPVNKDMPNYFLIVQDFIVESIKRGLIVGEGRGSVAASVVAYCLGIHKVEPLKHGLQFERFLHKQKLTLPDIDIDCGRKSRNLMIDYLKQKYGYENVCQMSSIQVYGLKNALKYVSEVLGLDKSLKEKLIEEFSIENFSSFEDLLINGSLELRNFVLETKDVQQLLEYAFVIKDVPSATPRHPAGIIISTEAIETSLPTVMVGKKGEEVKVSQISNDNNKLEIQGGYLKFDVLGVRNLDVEAGAIKEINESGVVLNHIPLNDKKTFELFKKGELNGVFQMESEGMKEFSRKMSPNKIEEVAILSAMYRPGPMDNIDQLIEQRNKEDFKMYNNVGEELRGVEDLKVVLKETSGVIVFQEQINLLVQRWSGYSLAEAELFREAVSKKKEEVLLSERNRFLKKSIDNNRERKTSEDIFDLILKFAKYGFNKAHATAYSLLSYRMAYLKVHFPLYFMASLLSSVVETTEICGKYIEEARRLGLVVKKPSINESGAYFKVENGQISFGLAMIKDIGTKVAEEIENIRANKPFANLEDFSKRTKGIVDKKVFTALSLVGAFDDFIKREDLLAVGERKFNFGEKVLAELAKMGTTFCISSNWLEEVSKEVKIPNAEVGVISKIIPWEDKRKRKMAKIEFVNFKGRKQKMVIFHYDWEKIKNDLVEGEVYALSSKENVIKKAIKINLGKS